MRLLILFMVFLFSTPFCYAQKDLLTAKTRKQLEAQLDTNSDEKKNLLKRCIDAENNFDTLNGQLNESKRKIEDLKAALQDLGKEHQALQVYLYFSSNIQIDQNLF